jgi:hypothetical protein
MLSLGSPLLELSDMYSGNGRLEQDVKQFPRDGTRRDRNISLLFHLRPQAGTDKPEEIASIKGYADHIRFASCSFVSYFGVNTSDYIGPSGRTIDELERIWKEEIVV